MVESLQLPSPVTAAAFGSSGRLGVASEDGTLRIYEAPYKKVWKAAKSLGGEISSVAFVESAEARLVWAACGQHVVCFNLDHAHMILGRKDAVLDIRLTDEDDDVLNEIATNGSYLAYTLDSGTVGVLELETQKRTTMRTSHANLCTNVAFIPGRPRELVSGGYDSVLLHFNYHLGSLLSSFRIEPSEPSAQVSLSPPFVLSVSVAQSGLIACGLADGRVWLGAGEERLPTSGRNYKKRLHKWPGLCAGGGGFFQVAEGPVVAVTFPSPTRLLSLTLLGRLTLHEVESGAIGKSSLITESPRLAKANVLAVHESHVLVGGLGSEKHGFVQLMERGEFMTTGDGSLSDRPARTGEVEVEV